jgi:hypothetical protein
MVLAVVTALYAGLWLYRIARWKAYIWIPSYLAASRAEGVADARKHLIFVLADHYEPGLGEAGVRANEAWLARFQPIAQRHCDAFGNRFRYTWFYPYDHRNEHVLARLCHMAHDGFGEIELHWHHPRASSETFPAMLDEAIAWFQRHGALISSGDQPQTHFAFIHGNWALDNSDPKCGVDRELEILRSRGCYADFTFSTLGATSQPSKINALYHATDTPGPKSYDNGRDAEVGHSNNNDLLIFEGPLMIDWAKAQFEYGALEDGPAPDVARVDRWIDANIHVRGRPEWVFVKLYTHGIQAAEELLGGRLELLLASLEERCRQRGIALHYMSAREACNVVIAAEEGRSGNPEAFRDYRVPKPRNLP